MSLRKASIMDMFGSFFPSTKFYFKTFFGHVFLPMFWHLSAYQEVFRTSEASIFDCFLNNKRYLKTKYIQVTICIASKLWNILWLFFMFSFGYIVLLRMKQASHRLEKCYLTGSYSPGHSPILKKLQKVTSQNTVKILNIYTHINVKPMYILDIITFPFNLGVKVMFYIYIYNLYIHINLYNIYLIYIIYVLYIYWNWFRLSCITSIW